MTSRKNTMIIGQRRQLGFTIIELMIVVAIVAILATLAFPSYQNARARSDRAIAIADITKIAMAQERYYTYNRSYTDVFADLSVSNTSVDGKYGYVITVPIDGATYSITSTPTTNTQDKVTLMQDNIGRQSHIKHGGTETNGWP